MSAFKINEQIAYLRKEKGLTQEELAKTLGVTNQAVSKWESAQCCPDIQLIPDMAKLFGVSIDELFGNPPPSESEDFVATLRQKIRTQPKEKDLAFTFQTATALHALLFAKRMVGGIYNMDNENTLEHAANGEWGYSGCNEMGMSTSMRAGAVFFANGAKLALSDMDIHQIVTLIKPFSDAKKLKIAATLHRLVYGSDSGHATVTEICNRTGISADTVKNYLDGELAPFLSYEVNGGEKRFRFEERYAGILSILSLLAFS